LWGELKISEEVEKHTKQRKLGVSPPKKFLVGRAAAPPAPPLYPSLSIGYIV